MFFEVPNSGTVSSRHYRGSDLHGKHHGARSSRTGDGPAGVPEEEPYAGRRHQEDQQRAR